MIVSKTSCVRWSTNFVRSCAMLALLAVDPGFAQVTAVSGRGAPSDSESLRTLWDLVARKPYFDQGSGERQAAERQPGVNLHLCISGDCQNGYGVAVGRTRSYYYRYEGWFLDGKFHGAGFMDRAGSHPIAAYWRYDEVAPGAMLAWMWDEQRWVLHRALGGGAIPISKPKGFPLAMVQAHQAQSFSRANGFEGISSPACYTPAEETRYRDTVRRSGAIVDRQVIRKTTGWMNTCKHKVYIRAVERIEQDGVVSYHDAPVVLDQEEFFIGNLPSPNTRIDKTGIYFLESYRRVR